MPTNDELVDEIERSTPDGWFTPALADGLDFLVFDEDVRPAAWKGPPAKKAQLKKLSRSLRDAGAEVPVELRALLRRHDGIALLGVPIDEGLPRGSVDPHMDAGLCSVDGILAAVDTLRAVADAGRAPSGILPFFCHDIVDVAYDCLVVDDGLFRSVGPRRRSAACLRRA